MDRLIRLIQATVAFTDLFQVPLAIAVVYSVKLSRRWGQAWKGIGVAFAGYTAWVIAMAFLVGFSPSGYLVVTLGALLDPIEPMLKATSGPRIWAIGVAGVVVLFWALPTGLAWLLRRKRPASPAVTPSRPWTTPAVGGLLLLAGQQVLLTYARRLHQEWKRGSGEPFGGSIPSGIALALTLPILFLLATAAARWFKLRRRTRPAS